MFSSGGESHEMSPSERTIPTDSKDPPNTQVKLPGSDIPDPRIEISVVVPEKAFVGDIDSMYTADAYSKAKNEDTFRSSLKNTSSKKTPAT